MCGSLIKFIFEQFINAVVHSFEIFTTLLRKKFILKENFGYLKITFYYLPLCLRSNYNFNDITNLFSNRDIRSNGFIYLIRIIQKYFK